MCSQCTNEAKTEKGQQRPKTTTTTYCTESKIPFIRTWLNPPNAFSVEKLSELKEKFLSLSLTRF